MKFLCALILAFPASASAETDLETISNYLQRASDGLERVSQECFEPGTASRVEEWKGTLRESQASLSRVRMVLNANPAVRPVAANSCSAALQSVVQEADRKILELDSAEWDLLRSTVKLQQGLDRALRNNRVSIRVRGGERNPCWSQGLELLDQARARLRESLAAVAGYGLRIHLRGDQLREYRAQNLALRASCGSAQGQTLLSRSTAGSGAPTAAPVEAPRGRSENGASTITGIRPEAEARR